MAVNDFGSIYSATGATTLTTSYSGTSIFAAGGESAVALWLTLVWANGTTATSTEVKLQGSYDGTNFVDLQTVDATNGNVAVEQTYTATDNTTEYHCIETTSNFLCYGGLRVQAKITGTVSSTDSVTVYAVGD